MSDPTSDPALPELDPATFGAALLMHRERIGKTRAALARRLGIPYRTWQDMEAGRRQPPAWVQTLLLCALSRMS